MAQKKHNETLEQQRRAREEFLNLKKMQSGELDAGPKPSEVAILPKTPKEKFANFWFHYKIHVIVIAFITVVLSVLITQCSNRVNYDSEIVYFSYTPILDSQLNNIADYFEQYATDINGDGEVNVQIINCSFSNDKQNIQYRNVQLQKMQSLMVADEKAMLYITDIDSIGYFDKLSETGGFFVNDPVLLGENFYKATKTEDFGELPEGLQISCRRISNTTLKDDGKAKTSFEAAQKILEQIKEQ